MSSATLKYVPSLESFLNVVETETLALFEDLLASCLRPLVVITNYERDDNPGGTIITV